MIKPDKLTFKRFCMTIGNLPSSYVESLSYYECLMWLCNYLQETVIPALNNNAEAVEELQQLFTQFTTYIDNAMEEFETSVDNKVDELETYMNNYFENLDVQEEINNKLEDMVEAGTLQEIISEYLNSKAIFGFDNVADMVASTNLIDGSYARTLGYHEKNDEGAALYRIREITNDDVIDNMQIISLDRDDLIAEYVDEDGVIRPEQFGAYGDDTHDDSTILNAMINIASEKNYKIKGNKTYKTSAPLVIVKDNLYLDLESIDYTGVENAIYLKGNNNNIYVDTLSSLGTGIYVTCDIDVCSFRNYVNINTINSAKNGIVLYSDSFGIFENEFTFKEISVSDNTYNGIYLYSSKLTEKVSFINQNTFNGGRVDGANYSLYADATTNGQINEILSYGISGEGSTNGIYLKKVTDSTFEDWRLEELTNTTGRLYMKLVGFTGNNNFRFNRYAPIELIDRTELTNDSHSPNIIFSNIRDTRQGVYVGSIMKFYGDKLINIVSPEYARSKGFADDITLGANEVAFFFNPSNTPVSLTPTITLNGMYGTGGINSFYVYKRTNYTSITVKLADNSSSVTITRDGINHIIIVGGLLLVQ